MQRRRHPSRLAAMSLLQQLQSALPPGGLGRIVARALLAGVLPLAVVLSCSDAAGPRAVDPVARVTITPDSASLQPGETRQLVATTKSADGTELTGRTIVWTTSDSAIARVSGGTVTAVREGTATISATSEGRVGRATITVHAPVIAVHITPDTVRVPAGGQHELQASASDAAGNALGGRTFAWSSSDTTVATVSAAGVVSAVKVGSASITATTEGVSASAHVVVVAPVASLAVDSTRLTLTAGETYALVATVRDANGATLADREVTWISMNDTVATVSTSGVVTARAYGTATIVATVEGKSTTVAVTVLARVGTVTIEPAGQTVYLGATRALTATVRDSAGHVVGGQPVTWTSDNPYVASVDSVGLVRTLELGRAVISATSQGKTGSATITVSPVPIASIALPATPIALHLGELHALDVQALDSAGGVLAERALEWSSSAPAVATVDGAGRVYGRQLGTATITAAAEGKSATTTVSVVQVPVATVAVWPDSVPLEVRDSTDLVAVMQDAGGLVLEGRTPAWSTSDPAVATVSATGRVRAVARGTAIIRATSEGQVSEAVVTVTPLAPVASISVSPNPIVVAALDTVHYTITLRDSTGRELSWIPQAQGQGMSGRREVSTYVTNDVAGGQIGTPHQYDHYLRGDRAGTGTLTVMASSGDQLASLVVPLTVTPPPEVGSVRFERGMHGLELEAGALPQGIGVEVRSVDGRVLDFRQVTVSSDNPAVVSVSESVPRSNDWRMTGQAPGRALLRVQAGEFSDTATVIVLRSRISTMKLEPRQPEVQLGATLQLRTELASWWGPITDYRTTIWESNDTTVATISAAGVVTGKKLGTASIWVYVDATPWSDGYYSESTLLRVVPVGVYSISVTPDPVALSVGATATLSAVARDQSGNVLDGRAFTFASSNPAVARVDTASGLVTGRSAGTAAITVTSEGKSTTVPVTVYAAGAVATVSIAPSPVSVPATRTAALTATLRDEYGALLTGRAITWSSAASSIATVSSTGVVTGVAVGSTSVTATSEGQSASVPVTVTAAPPGVQSISISPSSAVLAVRKTLQLSTVVYDVNGQYDPGREVTWASGDPAVATVSATGLITGVAVGRTFVRATSGGRSTDIDVQVTSGTGPVASVTVSPSTARVLQTGGTAQLTAAVRDAAGALLDGRAVTWSSDRPEVASVSSTGLVTGRAGGTVTITATSEGQSGTATVTSWLREVAGVSVQSNPPRSTITVGDTLRYSADVWDAALERIVGAAVTWRSTDPAVATVSADGLVTARGVGGTRIIASSGGKEGEAGLGVLLFYEIMDVRVWRTDSWSNEILVDSTADVTAEVITTYWDRLGPTYPVTWTSSNPAVATVEPTVLGGYSGPSVRVTGRGVGTTVITASADGKQDTIQIRVLAKPAVGKVEIRPSGGTMLVNATAQLTATVYSTAGLELTDRTVTWTTSNAGVVTVSSTGLITTRAVGTADITATSEGRSDVVTIRVVQSLDPVSTVTVTPATSTIAVGGTAQLTATMLDASGVVLSGREVYWSSSNSGIATVSSRGLVTGKSAGTATITAESEGRSGTATVTVVSSGSGGGGSGGGGSSGGSCKYVVSVGSLRPGETSSWVQTPYSGLDVKVQVLSFNYGNSTKPSYEYRLWVRNRYYETAELGYNLKVGTPPTDSYGAGSVGAQKEKMVDYYYGSGSGTVYVWVSNLSVGGSKQQCP